MWALPVWGDFGMQCLEEKHTLGVRKYDSKTQAGVALQKWVSKYRLKYLEICVIHLMIYLPI